jgi:acetyl-CoA carboxylase biotin carboxyl carrier protein
MDRPMPQMPTVTYAPPMAAAPQAPPPAVPGEPPVLTPANEDVDLAIVKSPIVGTFYRAAEPGAPPFVDTGQQVKKGQVLCIIEAMKLMNEIEAESAGTVVEILVENGKSVEFGQKLFKIRKA